MAKPKKTWQEKLHDNKGLPKIIDIPDRLSKRMGTGTMVIPAPLEVDQLMQQIGKGKLITINELREALSRKHKTNSACPITTGIFAWIAAYAADESETAGKKKITPYWRTLKIGGELNAKYPGGIDSVTKRLKAEGHKIEQRGKRFFVADYEKKLAKPE